VLPATRQRWHSRPYPSRSWYSIKRPRRDVRLSWPSWLVTYRDGMPARRRSPVQVRLRRVAETGTISTCYKTDLYSAISQAGRQEMNGGGCFVRKWNRGCFVKKVDLSPQNETKLTLDLFFILHFTFFGGGCVRTQRTLPAYGPNSIRSFTGAEVRQCATAKRNERKPEKRNVFSRDLNTATEWVLMRTQRTQPARGVGVGVCAGSV